MNKFYPVIHVRGVEHAIDNALIAYENNADGFFLINMGDVSDETFQKAFWEVYGLELDIPVGVNFLHPLDGIPSLPPGVNLWSDTLAGYHEGIRKNTFYGPYAFKYQPQPTNLISGLAEIEDKMDVITTSGVGTGQPPTLEKIQKIHSVAKKPIAIASGINSQNVVQFKPYVRDFLVGTSIGYANLIPEKVKELADIIHGDQHA